MYLRKVTIRLIVNKDVVLSKIHAEFFFCKNRAKTDEFKLQCDEAAMHMLYKKLDKLISSSNATLLINGSAYTYLFKLLSVVGFTKLT